MPLPGGAPRGVLILSALALALVLFLLSGRVALHAVLEVADPLFQVVALDLGRVVLVALVASVGLQGQGMASPAGAAPFFAVVDGEGMGFVVTGRGPGCGVVAGGAVGTEQAAVKVGVGVAGEAVAGCPLEYVARVAAGTVDCHMGAGQRKAGQLVVEGCLWPVVGCVAGATVLPEPALVGVVGGMAGEAAGGGGLQLGRRAGALVAGATGGRLVPAGEGK